MARGVCPAGSGAAGVFAGAGVDQDAVTDGKLTLQQVLIALFKMMPFMLWPVFWLLLKFGLFGLYLLILAFSPLFWLTYIFSWLLFIGAVRGNEPLPELFVQSARAVFLQPARFLMSSLIVTGSLIVVSHLLGKLLFGLFREVFLRAPTFIVALLVSLTMFFIVPFMFVIERALRPQLGVEPDLDPVEEEPGFVVPQGGESWREHVARQVESEGPDAAARALVQALRDRMLDRLAFQTALAALPPKAPVMAEMSKLATEWSRTGTVPDLTWLVHLGLQRDKAFLAADADTALSVAQRLAGEDQNVLAAHLLLGVFNRQHGQQAQREAGLRLARLMAFRMDNADGARRLLERIRQLFPGDREVDRLAAQLP